ncbi:probably inactive leucine-rich repeat receptor-like protein kinase At5g48380 [Quercus robur]|uniref:probably inactive leucine-rich repeat receptor-like protein kinase At5g48380 n=1 Tax=Quercus robur TaxID=38942 RepID=UPI002163EC33|nr:probably inactive leucine-rich repeat receptor-like protein kinase At5g48380 [Quercus robur]
MLLKSQTQMALNAGTLVLLCFIVCTFSESHAQSYVNNSGLCGGPLEEDCKKHRWVFQISFQSGFEVGFVAFAILYTAFFIYYFDLGVGLMERGKIIKRIEPGHVIQFPNVESRYERSKEISLLEKMATKISFMKLRKATNNFSANNVITSGKTGTVYKAMLPYGTFMAVKRLHASQHYENQFISELITLASLRHKNLVPLMGFCLEMQERLLVYGYMSNGSLHDWLHVVEDRAKMLEWPIRVKIIVGIARGLTWIHHMCHFQVVHLDISSKGILLHQNFEPKISTFGGAMFTNQNDIDLNKSCSINSEFREVELVKKDVYSFGIVVLELITGKEPTQMTNLFDFQESKFDLYDVIDKSLLGKGYDGEIFQFLRIACTCVQPCTDQRPTMLEVCKKLRAIRERNCLTVKDDFKLVRQPEIAASITEDDVIITVHTD